MYLNKKQLIERGWSLKLIEKFLGKPDDVNPLGRYCEEHRYFIPRIENVEKLEDFKTAQEKYLKRRSSGTQAAKKQSEKRIETAKVTPIKIKEMAFEDILEEAIWHFNSRNRGNHYDDEYYFQPATTDSNELFLERIAVNYIRHELTFYDSKLFAQKGRIGGGEAIPIIRRRVFEEIALAYPNLSDECDRQMLKRGLISESEIQAKKLQLQQTDHVQLELPF